MISLQLSEASKAISGQLSGEDSSFVGVGTDTRTLLRGQLFFALIGERYDGHDMLEEARINGAAGAVVANKDESVGLAQIEVLDPLFALGLLAKFWRKKFSTPVIGVTGSAGKTTVKEMLASILQKLGPTLVTSENMNNEIGLPLTLMRLNEESKAVVLEMGASKSGDIDYLAKIAEPDIGVITLCSPAHLSGFGTIENIARTKGELISSLPENGAAILNSDDSYFDYWHKLAGSRKVISFGESGDVSAGRKELNYKNSFDLNFSGQLARVSIQHLGSHNINNALAAAASAFAIGISATDVSQGLADASPVPHRLYPIRGKHRLDILDDSYNSNPFALKVALEVLKVYEGAKWVVLGDMNELGEFSEDFHRQAATMLQEVGVERLFTIGDKAATIGEFFSGESEHFQKHTLLINRLSNILKMSQKNICLLVKGSRSMKLERIVDAFSSLEIQEC